MSEPKPLSAFEFSLKYVQRFWSKVDKRSPDECWPWIPPVAKGRYGNFTIRVNGKSEQFKPSRLAYYFRTGIDLGSKFGCHTCDNPICCNDAHIFPGTQRDNVQDALKKGRFQAGDRHYARKHPEWVKRGEQHVGAILTEETVLAVYLAEGKRREVMKRFGVPGHMVSDIKKRRNWRHVTEGIEPVEYKYERPYRRKRKGEV